MDRCVAAASTQHKLSTRSILTGVMWWAYSTAPQSQRNSARRLATCPHTAQRIFTKPVRLCIFRRLGIKWIGYTLSPHDI